jgi:hypothetical protein
MSSDPAQHIVALFSCMLVFVRYPRPVNVSGMWLPGRSSGYFRIVWPKDLFLHPRRPTLGRGPNSSLYAVTPRALMLPIHRVCLARWIFWKAEDVTELTRSRAHDTEAGFVAMHC